MKRREVTEVAQLRVWERSDISQWDLRRLLPRSWRIWDVVKKSLRLLSNSVKNPLIDVTSPIQRKRHQYLKERVSVSGGLYLDVDMG
jgi:hypothetical protein